MNQSKWGLSALPVRGGKFNWSEAVRVGGIQPHFHHRLLPFCAASTARSATTSHSLDRHVRITFVFGSYFHCLSPYISTQSRTREVLQHQQHSRNWSAINKTSARLLRDAVGADVILRPHRCSTEEALPSGSSHISGSMFTAGIFRDEDVRIGKRRHVYTRERGTATA